MKGPPPVSLGSPRFHTQTVGPFLITDAVFRARTVLPPHHHDRAVVAVTLGGRWQSVLGNRRLELTAGILHTEPAGDTHSNYFGNDGARVVVIQPDPKADELLRPCRALLRSAHRLAVPHAIAIGRRVHAELSLPDSLSALALEAACIELLATAARVEEAGHRERPPAWLRRVVDYMHAEFLKNPTVEQLGVVAGVHPSHLTRAFRRAYRESPATCLRRLRIAWAGRQLTDTAGDIADIASAAGFCDQSHFTRIFKTVTGQTPSAYRRAARRAF